MEGGVWGLVIVASAFLIQVLVFGLSSSIGIYNIEFLHHFHHDTVGVSLIAAINWATFLGSGPLASFLMSKLSHRKVALGGSLLVVVGVGLMPLLPYIPAYCVCFGLLAGVGSCLVYVPSHVLTGQYYRRHQSLATGVATSGSGFGGAVMPIALGSLIDRYGWRGSLLIVAGLQLHLFVLSALLRPPPAAGRNDETLTDKDASSALRDGSSHTEEYTKDSEAVTLTANGCLSNNHDSAVVCEAVTVHGTQDVLISSTTVDREDERSTGEDALAWLNCSSQSDDCQAVTVHEAQEVLVLPPGVDREDEGMTSYETKALLDGSRNTVTVHSGNTVLRSSPAVDREDEKTASEEFTALLDGSSHTEKHTDVCKAETLTTNGSLSNNHVAFSSLEPAPTTNGYLSTNTNHKGRDACRRSSPASNPLESHSHTREEEATDLRHIYVFTHAGFDVYFLSHILWNAGGAVLMAFGPDFIVEHGISSMDAAWLLTIFGLGNFVGGVLGGVLGNAWPRVRRGQYMVANVVFGVCVLACPWAATFGQFAGVLVCGGLAFGVVLGLLVVLLIDLIGDRNLANGLGYLMLADGVGAFAGPAFTGYIRKVTGSYNAALYCGGVMGILAGVCMWLIPLIQYLSRWRRTQRADT